MSSRLQVHVKFLLSSQQMDHFRLLNLQIGRELAVFKGNLLGHTHFADVADIVEFWADAIVRQDRAALAGIATEAARRTTALRGPADDPTEELARDLGALGIVRAHTGSARGLIYAPDKVPSQAAAALQEAGFEDVLRFQVGIRS